MMNSYVKLHFINSYYDINDPIHPVKQYVDRTFQISTSSVGSTFFKGFITKNEYKVNDWDSFFSQAKTQTFYSFDKKEMTVRSSDQALYSARMVFRGDTKVNVYETNVLNLLEVLGTIGGVYELLYLFFAFILKVYCDWICNTNMIQNQRKKSNISDWFSYPTSLKKTQPKSK